LEKWSKKDYKYYERIFTKITMIKITKIGEYVKVYIFRVSSPDSIFHNHIIMTNLNIDIKYKKDKAKKIWKNDIRSAIKVLRHSFNKI